MKKYLLITLTCIISFASLHGQSRSAVSPSGGDLYSLPGFREITWGTHLDSVIKDGSKIKFTKSTELGDKNAYYIEDDDMLVGTVMLKSLYYIFNDNNRFVGVIMTAESKQFGEMKYILVNKFGNPDKEENPVSGKQYYWSVDDVRVSLINESINQIFTVDFTSDYERSESKRINRNVDDF